MPQYIKNLIKEHKELVVRLEKLNDYVYSTKGDSDDKVEFANKCIQLKGMRIYEEALRSRLNNIGINFDGITYSEDIDVIDDTDVEMYGSDFDVDTENLNKDDE